MPFLRHSREFHSFNFTCKLSANTRASFTTTGSRLWTKRDDASQKQKDDFNT